jgi:hypothetical protein
MQMIDVPVVCSHLGYPSTSPRRAEILPHSWRYSVVPRASAA